MIFRTCPPAPPTAVRDRPDRDAGTAAARPPHGHRTATAGTPTATPAGNGTRRCLRSSRETLVTPARVGPEHRGGGSGGRRPASNGTAVPLRLTLAPGGNRPESAQIAPGWSRGATPGTKVTKMYRAYRTSTFTRATPVGYRSGQAVRPPPANPAGPHGLRRVRSAAARPEPGTHRTRGESADSRARERRRANLPKHLARTRQLTR